MRFKFWKKEDEKEEKKVSEKSEIEAASDLNAKIELLATKIESLKINQETINEKIKNIEKMVREIYEMAKS